MKKMQVFILFVSSACLKLLYMLCMK